MKKSDLKSGMIVKNAHHNNLYIVIGDNLVDKTGFLSLSKYDQDLNFEGTNDWSIIEVFETNKWGAGLSIVDYPHYLKSIWKREDEPKFKEGEWVYIEFGGYGACGGNGEIGRVSVKPDKDEKYSGKYYSSDAKLYVQLPNDFTWGLCEGYRVRKATSDEIKDALVKEAEKKGYEPSNFRCLYDGKVWSDTSGQGWNYTRNGELMLGAGVCYKDGKWAELVPSIEIDVKINGNPAKLSDISEDTLKTLRNA